MKHDQFGAAQKIFSNPHRHSGVLQEKRIPLVGAKLFSTIAKTKKPQKSINMSQNWNISFSNF